MVITSIVPVTQCPLIRPFTLPVEDEIEEDEITSESEEYDGDYGSSDESEDDFIVDSIKKYVFL